MKKTILVTLISICLLAKLPAQEPPFDPKSINKTGQKKIDPGQLKPLPPARVVFIARIRTSRELLAGTDDNKIKRFEVMDANEGNGFDAASGLFTAPAAGVYCFIFNVYMTNYGCADSPVNLRIMLLKNGAEADIFQLPVSYGNGLTTQGFNTLLLLNAGDRVQLGRMAVLCQGGNFAVVQSMVFSGYMIK